MLILDIINIIFFQIIDPPLADNIAQRSQCLSPIRKKIFDAIGFGGDLPLADQLISFQLLQLFRRTIPHVHIRNQQTASPKSDRFL